MIFYPVPSQSNWTRRLSKQKDFPGRAFHGSLAESCSSYAWWEITGTALASTSGDLSPTLSLSVGP